MDREDSSDSPYPGSRDAGHEFNLVRGDLWAKKENPYMLFNEAGKDACVTVAAVE